MSAVANAVNTSASRKKLQGEDSVVNTKAKALVGLIHNKPLPIFKQTLQRLGGFYDKPNSSIPKVVDCLRLDPGYSYQILCKANKGLTTHKRKPASTLQHAVLVLGIPQVIAIGKELPLISEIKQSTAKSWIFHIMCRMYHAGVQARELMADLDQNAQDTAFISAQLRETYFISLWFHAPAELEQLIKSSSLHTLMAPNGVLNTVGRIIAEQNSFPVSTQQSFTPQANSSRLVKTIALANHIAQLAEDSWYSPAMKELISVSSMTLGIPEAVLGQQTHQNAIIAARESNFYPIKPAACRLVEREPVAEKKVIETKAIETKTVETKKPVVKKQPVAPKKVSAPPVKPSTMATKTVKPQPKSELTIGLNKLIVLGRAKHSPQEILEFGFVLLQNYSVNNPVAFLLLDKNKTFLKSRFTANFENKQQSLVLPLKQKNIFKVLMQKQQSILLTENNRTKFSSLLPADLALPVDKNYFAAISVFIQNKPIGLFYLESKTSQSIPAGDYQKFITICKATITSLEEVKKNA